MEIQKLGLGQIITTEQQKDAVHIAVAPVTAGLRLHPGDHVTVGADGVAYYAEKTIGVVDPFCLETIQKGQQFWLFLYPGTITGLRHEWSHPAFEQKQANSASEPVSGVKAAKSESERWMRVWAVKHMGEDYYDRDGPVDEDVAYGRAIEAGHSHSIGSNESARDYIDDEWWNHWEAITGQKGDRESYFSCAC